MSSIQHLNCFICRKEIGDGERCHHVDGKIFCQDDFLLSAHSRSYKSCTECSAPVTNKLIQAVTGYYHSHCFKCKLCQKPLENDEYSVDQDNQVYCLEDFCYLFGPKCGKCEKTIYPVENTALLIRVKAMNKDFHVDCFVCESCGCHLSEDSESRCYPLNGSALCSKCHVGKLHTIISGKKTVSFK